VVDETGTGQKFRVIIVSEDFAGKTTLSNHRSVQCALANLMPSIHALTIQAYDTNKWSQERLSANSEICK
uniref:Bola-like protein n=1 Tax=Syphacia muris TaxID=451379 RepID=A0A0N5AKS8_9BILA